MNEPTDRTPPVVPIDASRVPEVVDVLRDAFFDYPTMRFVIGAGSSDYGDRLSALIGFFLDATRLKGGNILALEEEGELVAAADAVLTNSPGSPAEPSELGRRREALWRHLGPAARARYEAYSALTEPFAPARAHYYLSMLGVRRRCAGRGLARLLVDEVQAMSRTDPTSTGVALETEDPANVAFYQHFGYRLVGHQRVGGGIESWGFFRPDES